MVAVYKEGEKVSEPFQNETEAFLWASHNGMAETFNDGRNTMRRLKMGVEIREADLRILPVV